MEKETGRWRYFAKSLLMICKSGEGGKMLDRCVLDIP